MKNYVIAPNPKMPRYAKSARRASAQNGRLVATFIALALSSTATAAPSAGREIAHGPEKGNCLACHKMPADPEAETLATLGPTLEKIKQRYPDRAKLRAQIWDARKKNPATIMPPYGAHRILTEEEIDQVVEYIYGL